MTFPTEWKVIKFHGSKPPSSQSYSHDTPKDLWPTKVSGMPRPQRFSSPAHRRSRCLASSWRYLWKAGKPRLYPLVKIQKSMENGPVEIVSFPMKNGGSFHSKLDVNPRGIEPLIDDLPIWKMVSFHSKLFHIWRGYSRINHEISHICVCMLCFAFLCYAT